MSYFTLKSLQKMLHRSPNKHLFTRKKRLVAAESVYDN